jgi:hypothetical protein
MLCQSRGQVDCESFIHVGHPATGDRCVNAEVYTSIMTCVGAMRACCLSTVVHTYEARHVRMHLAFSDELNNVCFTSNRTLA